MVESADKTITMRSQAVRKPQAKLMAGVARVEELLIGVISLGVLCFVALKLLFVYAFNITFIIEI